MISRMDSKIHSVRIKAVNKMILKMNTKLMLQRNIEVSVRQNSVNRATNFIFVAL